MVGLVEDHRCDLPITQAEFADAIGTSNVHVYRVLQQMRADGLIETQGTKLRIPDWNKLKEVGEFDRTYLHLVREADPETSRAGATIGLGAGRLPWHPQASGP